MLNKFPRKEDHLSTEDIKHNRLRRITSLNLLVDYSNIKLTSRNSNLNHKNEYPEDDENDSDNNENNKYNEYKDNILTSVEELINELESISEVIKDQATDHINDNDVILTANYSDQLVDFFVEASQTKSFHLIITESAPSLKYFYNLLNYIL